MFLRTAYYRPCESLHLFQKESLYYQNCSDTKLGEDLFSVIKKKSRNVSNQHGYVVC